MTREPARYVALSPNEMHRAGDLPVVLAARKSPHAEARKVIALSVGDARWLLREGRLDGWTPPEDRAPASAGESA